ARFSVFQNWKSAHTRLVLAIQEYFDACTTLETALTAPIRDLTSRYIQRKTLDELDPELPRLNIHEERLQEARLRLNGARNLSQTAAPINSLPPEILVTIFFLATQEWVDEDYQHVGLDMTTSASDLSGVCRLWRRVTFHCHSLWSEIDLLLTGSSSTASYKRAALWAERSQNAPLNVNVGTGDDALYANEPHRQESEISQAVTFLAPLMPRVRALRINSDKSPATKLVSSLLYCWVQNGVIGTAKELGIRSNIDLQELELPGISPNARDRSLRPQELSAFLSSLSNVHFENVALNWGHQIYSGLTEICIEFAFQSHWFPSQPDVANLLAANPGLRSLLLYGVRIRAQNASVPTPVPLDHLKVLGLETMDAKDLGLILPLISSTSDAIRVSLSLNDDPTFISAARAFFSRTKVTLLHADGALPGGDPTISALFVYMPYLHTLVVQCCNLSEDVLQDLVHRRASDNKSMDFWPALRQLYVLQCDTNPQILRQIVDIHAPRMLWLYETRLNNRSGYSLPQARTELQEELSQRGVQLIWHYDERRSPAYWTF
ncbi:hypothetical protein FRC07_014064, partial [Ceratobasidium sp. 392]